MMKKGYLVGGLITKGIKAAIKKLGKKTKNLQRDQMAKSIKEHRRLGFGTSYRTKDMSPLDKKIKRLQAKEDMRAGISMYLKDPKDKAKIRASRQKSIAPTIKAIGESIRFAGKYKKKIN